MVLMNIRGDAPEDQVKLLSETAYEMTNLGTVDRLSFGQAHITNGKDLAHPKFNYGLLVTHPNKKAAADYQTDPLHEKFKAISKPLLEDSGCGKVFTLNYAPPDFYQSGVGSGASGFIGFAVGVLVGALGVCAYNHIKNRRQTSGDNEYNAA